jgi:prepilin-type N-terminal cleavage/methylation domain-containing protein
MRRGFTLLEVVISTAIIGMIGTAIYGSVDRSFDMKEEVAAHSERYRQASVSLERISRELAQAFVSNHVLVSEPRTQTIFDGSDDEVRFTAFSHTVLRAGAHEGDQETIAYRLGEDPDPQAEPSQGKCLLRWSAPRILDDVEADDQGRVRVLICGVDELLFEYHAEREDDWSESWRTEDVAHKDSDADGVRARLPDRVRISLRLHMPGDQRMLFRTATKIRLTKALNF